MKQTGVAILLVEDDPDMAEIFRLGLTFAGHDVEVMGDGGAAFLQHRDDVPQRLDRLLAHVADADHLAGLVPGDLAGGEDQPAAFRPRRIGKSRARLEHQRGWTQNLFRHRWFPLVGRHPVRSGRTPIG